MCVRVLYYLTAHFFHTCEIIFYVWKILQRSMGELANFMIVKLNIDKVHIDNAESNGSSPTNDNDHICSIGLIRTTDIDKWLVSTLEDNGIDEDDSVFLYGHSSGGIDTTISRIDNWLIDSRSWEHMTGDKSLFSTLSETERCGVQMGKKSVVEVGRRGVVMIEFIVNGRQVPCMPQNVLYVRNPRFNLRSVSVMEAKRIYCF